MKKIFNNKGVTLVEVIVAVVILGIITAPIFNSLFQTFKINMSSDKEIRMNATIQRLLEEVKAVGRYNEYQYFDNKFNPVSATEKYYTIMIQADINAVGNSDQYDRWDFDFLLSPNSTNSNRSVVSVSKSLGSYQPVGKLLNKTNISGLQSIQTRDNFMNLEFMGENSALSGQYTYRFQYKNNSGVIISTPNTVFTPGNGLINQNSDKTIVVNVIRADNTPEFVLNIINSTCYINYTSNQFKFVAGELSYNKHIIVNIYNNDNTKPVIVNSTTPFVDVVYRNEVTPHIVNGDKVTVTVFDNKNNVIKKINSVIGKDVIKN